MMESNFASLFPPTTFHPRPWLIFGICRFAGSRNAAEKRVWSYDPFTLLIFSPIRGFPPDIYRREGVCAVVAAPMLKENKLVGAIVLTRREARPFNEGQINLLTTFANQAAIALDNVHLFQELKDRTQELARYNEEIKKANEKLKELDRLKSSFVSNVSHAKNTLTAIEGLADNLLMA